MASSAHVVEVKFDKRTKRGQVSSPELVSLQEQDCEYGFLKMGCLFAALNPFHHHGNALADTDTHTA